MYIGAGPELRRSETGWAVWTDAGRTGCERYYGGNECGKELIRGGPEVVRRRAMDEPRGLWWQVSELDSPALTMKAGRRAQGRARATEAEDKGVRDTSPFLWYMA